MNLLQKQIQYHYASPKINQIPPTETSNLMKVAPAETRVTTPYRHEDHALAAAILRIHS
jgi:hypothetical protein